MMPGRKLFTNNTDEEIYIHLPVRNGLDPATRMQIAQSVVLKPRESSWRTYGGPNDILLNGIRIHFNIWGGKMVETVHEITRRGSELDDRLNRYNAIDINYVNGVLSFASRQVNEG